MKREINREGWWGGQERVRVVVVVVMRIGGGAEGSTNGNGEQWAAEVISGPSSN